MRTNSGRKHPNSNWITTHTHTYTLSQLQQTNRPLTVHFTNAPPLSSEDRPFHSQRSWPLHCYQIKTLETLTHSLSAVFTPSLVADFLSPKGSSGALCVSEWPTAARVCYLSTPCMVQNSHWEHDAQQPLSTAHRSRDTRINRKIKQGVSSCIFIYKLMILKLVSTCRPKTARKP